MTSVDQKAKKMGKTMTGLLALLFAAVGYISWQPLLTAVGSIGNESKANESYEIRLEKHIASDSVTTLYIQADIQDIKQSAKESEARERRMIELLTEIRNRP